MSRPVLSSAGLISCATVSRFVCTIILIATALIGERRDVTMFRYLKSEQ